MASRFYADSAARRRNDRDYLFAHRKLAGADGTSGHGRIGTHRKRLRAAFIDIAHLQPRITVNNRVYMEQTRPVSELVVLSRRIEVEHELLHTWVGSSKRVKLHGTFNAKAGFDLRQNLSIDIRPDEIIVQLPHAQILGIEEGQLDVLAFENGLWNRISGEDVQGELSILPQLAREKQSRAGCLLQAEHALRQQLEQRIHTQQPLRLMFTNGKRRIVFSDEFDRRKVR